MKPERREGKADNRAPSEALLLPAIHVSVAAVDYVCWFRGSAPSLRRSPAEQEAILVTKPTRVRSQYEVLIYKNRHIA